MSRDVRIRCPHCDAPAKIRTSRAMSKISREVYYHCTNSIYCGFVWHGLISAVRTIRPSLTPNPDVHIPLSDKAPTSQLATPPPTG